MPRRFLLLSLFLLLVAPAGAQSFHGSVVDATSGEPLPGAHVFIDGTDIGDVVSADGTFSLALPAHRPLLVVISMIGFRLQTISVDHRYELTDARTIEMQEDPVLLEGFVVEAVTPRALRRLRGRVENLLFSSTPAGSRCEVENPGIMDVANVNGELRVVAREPLRVNNPYLGYRVTIHGMRLEGTQRFYDFTGRFQFEELPAANDRVLRSREERRNRTYGGSRQHFLRALVEGKLSGSGFEAEVVSGPGFMGGGDTILEMTGSEKSGGTSILYGDADDYTRSLIFTGAVMVRYKRERPLPAYSSFLRSLNVPEPNTRDRISWLTLPTGVALLDRNGTPFADTGAPPITHYGYWSWERVCDMLPADWTPED